jgi:hypothetical protein
LTPVVIARALILYWRRGITVAMASHFYGDLVLHVLAPTLISRA